MDNDKQATTLAEAASLFLATVPAKDQQNSQQQVNKFIRWCGTDRPVSSLNAREVEAYAEGIGPSATNPEEILKPTKAFLVYLKKQGLMKTNLSVNVKLKKTAESTGAAERPQQLVQMTADGHAELQRKLDKLRAERPHIAEELKRARADKDFRENAPLDAAREHQAQVEAQIRELEATLRVAEIVDNNGKKNEDKLHVDLGSTILIYDLTHEEELRYTLVSASEASPAKARISTSSPLGKELLDRTVGEVVEVNAPVGLIKYRIDEIEK